MSVVGRVQINDPGNTGPVLPPSPVPGGGEDEYLALIIADGAVAAWPLSEDDGTSTYSDAIGSIPAVLSSGTTATYAAAGIGPAAVSPAFVGSGAVQSTPGDLAVETAHAALYEVGTGDFAMEAWMQSDGGDGTVLGHTPMYLINSALTSGIGGILLGPAFGAGEGQVQMSDQYSAAAVSPPDYGDGLVHHYVFTRRGGSYFVIVDGDEVANHTPGTAVDLSGTEAISIAGINYNAAIPGAYVYVLHGQIAWCAFYGAGLTASQAMAHYLAGSP